MPDNIIKPENEILTMALQYAKLGWYVFPAHGIREGVCTCGVETCESQGKHPRTPNGFKDATRDEVVIQGWWSKWPDANIAVATGAISGIVVLDLDIKHGRSSKELREKGYFISPTVSSKTGVFKDPDKPEEEWKRGEHFIFKHPGGHVMSTNGQILGLGVDIKADGGYVMLPPSNHLSGVSYEWVIEPEGEGSLKNLEELPKWLLEKISTQKDVKIEWSEFLKQENFEGSRYENATRYVGKLLHHLPQELWETSAWPMLLQWHRSQNQKSDNPRKDFTEKELRSIFVGIAKKEIANKKDGKKTAEKSEVVLRRFSEITSQEIKWLWAQRFALGKVTLISGDPGLGKSLVTTAMAAHVSKGYPWPVGGAPCPTGDVILLSAEDDEGDTIKPRLDAAGADCSRVYILNAIKEQKNGEETERMFSLKNDIPQLEKALSSLPECRLVVIDPISAYLDGSDGNANGDIRGLLAPLTKLAAKHNAALIIVSHLNKNDKGTNALYRTMGSLAFVAAARAAYVVVKDQENPTRRLILSAKNNIAKDTGGIAYSVTGGLNGAPVIAWEPEEVPLTADEGFLSMEPEEKNATDEAIEFLREELKDGAKSVGDIFKVATKAGISDKPLRNAKEKLGIHSRKVDYTRGWEWKLPEKKNNDSVATPPTEQGIFEEAGHLHQNNEANEEPKAPKVPSLFEDAQEKSGGSTTPKDSLNDTLLQILKYGVAQKWSKTPVGWEIVSENNMEVKKACTWIPQGEGGWKQFLLAQTPEMRQEIFELFASSPPDDFDGF